jgi:hypothetical protein
MAAICGSTFVGRRRTGGKRFTSRGQYHRRYQFIPLIAGKWLELLKELVPRLARVALVINPDLSSETYFAAIDAAGPNTP